ncbi:hypothetical protein GCM10027020_04710 [Nocardioides salsibiostraticola]
MSAEVSPSVSEASGQTPPSTSALGSDSAAALDELATAASQRVTEMPPLLPVANKTSDTVRLTSADGQNTATVDLDKSFQLASKRVCDSLPLTASASDGRVIEESMQPRNGQTWTITDKRGAQPGWRPEPSAPALYARDPRGHADERMRPSPA